MKQALTEKEIIEVLVYVFDIQEELNSSSDLSLYIKDSIDLGEFLAVIKNKHGLDVEHKELFRKYTALSDVLKIINNEIRD